MWKIDNTEKINNLDISFSAWSKWRFIESIMQIDSIPLKEVLKTFYEYKLLEYVSNKEYDSIEKLEWVLELLEITKSKLSGK